MPRIRDRQQEVLDRKARTTARRVGLRASKLKYGFKLEGFGHVIGQAMTAEEVIDHCRGMNETRERKMP
jgi:hypothetical protein